VGSGGHSTSSKGALLCFVANGSHTGFGACGCTNRRTAKIYCALFVHDELRTLSVGVMRLLDLPSYAARLRAINSQSVVLHTVIDCNTSMVGNVASVSIDAPAVGGKSIGNNNGIVGLCCDTNI
jgi:hypothetical protein